MRVDLFAEGACSFTEPRANAEERLEAEVVEEEEQPLRLHESPATVYLTAAGTCTIEAIGSGDIEYESPPQVSQSFAVAKDPSEQITFTSPPPSDATVGDSYNPVVRLSAGIRVSFFTTTPSVCAIAPRDATVSLVGPGTCTVGARQKGVLETGPPEALQSFTVYGLTVVERPSILPTEPPATQPKTPPAITPTTEPKVNATPTKVKKSPTKAHHSTKKRKSSAEDGIPAKVRSKLLEDVRSVVRKDHLVRAFDIKAVTTTEERVLQLEGQSIPAGFTDRNVYFVAARVQGYCHGPGPCEAGADVIELTVSVTKPSPRPVEHAYAESYPDLNKLGVPVLLAAKAG